jgi:hypothetical protein
MKTKHPHVKWWTTSGAGTHAELYLDNLDAELFYPEPPYYPDKGVLYLCGYVKSGAAYTEQPEAVRCATCIARLPWAKQEGDRLIAEYHARLDTIARVQDIMRDPSTNVEDHGRAELARLLKKYGADKNRGTEAG